MDSEPGPSDIRLRPDSPSRLKRRRRQHPTACQECRRRKIKCDSKVPCDQCALRKEANLCHFDPDASPGESLASRIQSMVDNGSIPYGSLPYIPANADIVQRLNDRVQQLEREIIPRLLHLERLSGVEGPVDRPGTPNLGTSISEARPSGSTSSIPFGEDVETTVLELEELGIGSGGAGRNYGPLGLREDPSPATVQVITPNMTEPTGCEDGLLPSIYRSVKTIRPNPLCNTTNVLLNAILQNLPTKHVADVLFAAYAREQAWSWLALYLPSFSTQTFEFWSLVQSDERYLIDPAWLALFCTALAIGCKDLRKSARESLGWTLETQLAMIRQLYDASRFCLAAADWSSHPQIRVIQTICFYGTLLVNSSRTFFANSLEGAAIGEDKGLFSTWLSAGIQLARRLKLDQVDAGALLSNDAAWPPGDSTFKREMARRIWTALVVLDQKTAGDNLKGHHIAPESHHTSLPMRIVDIETKTAVVEVDSSTYSDVDPLLYQYELAMHLGRLSRLVHQEGKPTTYNQMLELDTQFRHGLRLHLHLDLNGGSHFSDQRRAVLGAASHNRVLRLHRRWLIPGLESSQFPESVKCCLVSARAILTLYREKNLAIQRAHKASTFSHILSAAIVIHLCRQHARTMPDPQLAPSDTALFGFAIQFFQQVAQEDHFSRSTTESALRACDILRALQDTSNSDRSLADTVRYTLNLMKGMGDAASLALPGGMQSDLPMNMVEDPGTQAFWDSFMTSGDYLFPTSSDGLMETLGVLQDQGTMAGTASIPAEFDWLLNSRQE